MLVHLSSPHVFLFFSLVVCVYGGSFSAGVAKVDATLPIGSPIAGYNHGDRRVPHWPLPVMTTFTTFMTPSQGVLDPTYVKALVIDDGTERICFVTLDLMCADSSLAFLAHLMARVEGFTVPFEKVTFSGSHTHSGPGGWVPQFGIQVTPTMDLFVPELQRQLAASIAKAMVEAERNLQPATVGIQIGYLIGVTQNRRAGESPYVNSTTIDPNLGVLRVDDSNGNAIATLWNYATHGTCYGPSNMKFSSDIMGYACQEIEVQGGGVAMFINGDAGDISPTGTSCSNAPTFTGGLTMANTVIQVRSNTSTASTGTIKAASANYNFGPTQTNWTLARDANCTSGGPLDICSICKLIDCTLNLQGGMAWVEENPRFTAFSMSINGQSTLFSSIPGEAILELGWQIRNDSLDLGFDNTFLVGYTNNYLMYFTTPNEYLIGGYEANLSLWGIDTGEKIRASCYSVAKQVVQ